MEATKAKIEDIQDLAAKNPDYTFSIGFVGRLIQEMLEYQQNLL